MAGVQIWRYGTNYGAMQSFWAPRVNNAAPALFLGTGHSAHAPHVRSAADAGLTQPLAAYFHSINSGRFSYERNYPLWVHIS